MSTVVFRVGRKGSSKSGNHGHAGRPGKLGGSAPRATGYVAAAHDNLEELPCYKRFGNDTSHRLNGGLDTHPHDTYLKAILHDQGFDGKPEVVPSAELDKYVAQGETEVWRGLNGGMFNAPISIAQKRAEQFKTGKLFVGRGVYGNGTYAGEKGTALDFAMNDGTLLRMTIRKDAKVVDIAQVKKEIHDDQLAKNDITPANMDNGHWAASHGYDVIHVPGNLQRGIDEQWVILNRTALRVDAHTYTFDEALAGLKELPVAVFKVSTKGSAKSGNRGHVGRPGKVGGSAPKSVEAPTRLRERDEIVTLDKDAIATLRSLIHGNPDARVDLLDGDSRISMKASILLSFANQLSSGELSQYKIVLPRGRAALPPKPVDDAEPIARAKYDKLEDMPAFKQYGNTDPQDDNRRNEDMYLAAMIRDQGFDGKPHVISPSKMDAFVHHGEIEIFRGLSGSIVPGEPTAKDRTNQFRYGDLFVGRGVYGNGTYTTTSLDTAKGYGSAILRMTIRKDAKTSTLDDMKQSIQAELHVLDARHDADTDAHRAGKMSNEEFIQRLSKYYEDYGKLNSGPTGADWGRYAAFKGIDAYSIGKGSETYWVIINRTAVRVQDEDM